MVAGSATAFFAYIGFDAVASAAEEVWIMLHATYPFRSNMTDAQICDSFKLSPPLNIHVRLLDIVEN